jgi:hypothetical protein
MLQIGKLEINIFSLFFKANERGKIKYNTRPNLTFFPL